MTVLLEMKERLKLLYSKSEVFIVPIVKFLLAFITFNTLNDRMGYMALLDDMRIVLMAALACSFLPLGIIVLLGAVFSLMHMYALSLEVALVGLCVYLIMYLLFFRFSPKDSLVVVLTPLLCALRIPYVVPIVVGLLCAPSSAVSVGCGVAVYYLLLLVTDSAPNIRTMGADEDALAKIRMLVESFLGNKAMLVIIAAFAITVVTVYLIRRMSVNYAWTIAMITGAMVNIVALLVGDLYYDINLSVGSVLLGSLLAIAVAKVIEFFRFCVDYSRTEKVQFEDDEYYYYVKAIPKMAVPAPARTVKRINSQRRETGGGRRESDDYPAANERQGARTVTTERSSSAGRAVRTDRGTSGAGPRQGARTVVTERSEGSRQGSGQRTASGGSTYQGGRNGRPAGTERNAADRSNTRNTGRSQGRGAAVGRTPDRQNYYEEDEEWP